MFTYLFSLTSTQSYWEVEQALFYTGAHKAEGICGSPPCWYLHHVLTAHQGKIQAAPPVSSLGRQEAKSPSCKGAMVCFAWAFVIIGQHRAAFLQHRGIHAQTKGKVSKAIQTLCFSEF